MAMESSSIVPYLWIEASFIVRSPLRFGVLADLWLYVSLSSAKFYLISNPLFVSILNQCLAKM